MRASLTVTVLLAAALAGLLASALTGLLQAADEPTPPVPPYLAGEVAFSEVLVFDYDRDGTRDQVQFWIAVEGQPAVGKPGEPGARPESGSVRYFVVDVERKTKIKDWLMGFNMGFPAPEEPHPITRISVDGPTASFELKGATWTITDAGDSWDKDRIELKDASGIRKGRFYAGDFRVVPAPAAVEPLAIAENAACNECHHDAAAAMAAGGGPHRELHCDNCHVKHPPDAPGEVPQCLSCHTPHSAAMGGATCTTCHRDHAVAAITYGVAVPDAHCAACHEGPADALRASRSLHMGLACVLCHRDEHGAIADCQYCHRAVHPQHVMQKPLVCGSCHQSAHALESGRTP